MSSGPPPPLDPATFKPDEPEIALFNERTSLEGTIATGIVYGVHFTLYVMCMHLLINTRKKTAQTWSFIAYITIMFILGTLYMASAARTAELQFIDQRNYPGGPAQWELDFFSIPISVMGSVVYVMATWFADGLMLWRCLVIWRDTRYFWAVMILPTLMYLGSFGTSIVVLVFVSQPTLNFWSTVSVNLEKPYFILSLCLNVIVTIAIVARLLAYKTRVSATLGPQHATQYTSVAAMIVESAALYSVFSIVFLVAFVENNPIQNVFLQVLSQIQIIAPLLIIYRVALGRAWSSDTTAMNSRYSNNRYKGSTNGNVNSATALESGSYPMVTREVHVSFNDGGKQTSSFDDRLAK